MGLSDKICGDQLDNYILGSFAIYLMGVPPQLPVIAYAAGNKQSFEGWHGEIANLRALILFGYDVDAAIEDGRTALHLMSSLRWGKGVHLRAIKALLEAGANPNIRNVVGDSAFTFLCGSFPWTSEAHEAALMMLEHGADAHLPADDGSTGVSLLRANQAAKDQSLARQALIEMIELRHATGPGEAVPRTAPRL